MDDVLKRLGAVEGAVSETRSQISTILALIPTLATKADLKEEVGSLRAEMKEGFGALRAEMKEMFGSLRAEMKEMFGSLRAETKADIGAMEVRMTKWVIRMAFTAAAIGAAVAGVILHFAGFVRLVR